MKETIATGKTVEIAIANGLKTLGLTREQVEVEVLSEGGFLKSCKVRLTKKPTEGEQAQNFIEEVLQKMGLTFTSELTETEDEIHINLIGTDSGTIIGHRGEVLDALQYLTSITTNKNRKDFKRIVLDTENYREKRNAALVQLAHNLESKVKRTHKKVRLEPMNPYERRILHSALQDSEYVTTSSDGVAPNRYVVIFPKQAQQKEQPKENRKQLNFVYRSKNSKKPKF